MINGHIAPHLHAETYRRCLAELDVPGMRALHHAATGKELSEAETLAIMHHARTQAASLSLRQRAYSHRWLIDHELPSGLPDWLKPQAERLYPRRVEAVGIAVGNLNGAKSELSRALEVAMSDAVAELYADGKTEPTLIRQRMFEAYHRLKRGA